MPKQILLFLLLVLLVGCKKKSSPAFICDVEQNIPEGDSARLLMPNAFTPNGDGINDRIFPIFKNLVELEFTVYDQNNNVLFHTNKLNGSLYDPGSTDKSLTVYYYKIKAITTSGNPALKCGKIYGLTCLPSGSTMHSFLFSDQFDFSLPDGYQKVTADYLPFCN